MNIKSLLLGSAAALVAVSGARAADAVVIPEPEAVEYVRVCDAAGAGYFYIPGSETCLKFSGYVRYEMNLTENDNGGVLNNGYLANEWNKRSEVRLDVEAWNDTELGPLYSRVRIGYDQDPRLGGAGIHIDHAVIQLAGLTIGKNASWWDWGFGADGDGIVNFGPGEVGMVAYTANAGGFGITLALEEDVAGDGDYMPDVVLDVDGSVGQFGVRAGLAYNESAEALTGKIYASYDFGAATIGLGYQYSDDDALGAEYLANFEHVIGADISADLTEKLSARAGFNYGMNWLGTSNDGYIVGAGVNYEIVSGFDVDARIRYANGDNVDGEVDGRIRFTRAF
ncbi:porin [Ahrensia kielensis]|uniref:porin n=1 Tax=Ahrensia kielensis TaxID=76980 RepID=UPI0003690F19|nr:porin [Ahrensia kielensis]